jgi:hypothetical protein
MQQHTFCGIKKNAKSLQYSGEYLMKDERKEANVHVLLQ